MLYAEAKIAFDKFHVAQLRESTRHAYERRCLGWVPICPSIATPRLLVRGRAEYALTEGEGSKSLDENQLDALRVVTMDMSKA